MIQKADFRNYKLLRDVEVELSQLSVIVGANGSGKSTVLEGLHHLLQLGVAEHWADRHSGGRIGGLFSGDRSADLLCSRPNRDCFQLVAETKEGQTFGLRLATRGSKEESRFWLVAYEEFAEKRTELGAKASEKEVKDFFARTNKLKFGSVLRTRLDATALARDHYSDKPVPRIEYDGTGLASVIQYLQGLRDGTIERIEEDLARIVPGVRRIRSLPARIKRKETTTVEIDGEKSEVGRHAEYTGATFEIEWDKIGWIPARQLSEGTVLVLGILTMLRFRAPRLLLLDDVDRGLHPTAQRELVCLLKDLLRQDPDLQIITTSHSPFVLNELEPDQMLAVARGDDGFSKIRKLCDHPSWESQSEYLKPGEFWSAVGEKWVTESE